MTHDLAPFVTAFFVRHLPAERNLSPHTIAAYRDALKLLLRYVATALHRSAAALHEVVSKTSRRIGSSSFWRSSKPRDATPFARATPGSPRSIASSATWSTPSPPSRGCVNASWPSP